MPQVQIFPHRIFYKFSTNTKTSRGPKHHDVIIEGLQSSGENQDFSNQRLVDNEVMLAINVLLSSWVLTIY